MRRLIVLVLASFVVSCGSDGSAPPPPEGDGSVDSATDTPLPPDVGDGGGEAIDAIDAAPPDDLDALLEPIRSAHGFPSLAGAVFDGTKVLAQGAVGVRKLGDPTKVTTSDVWHLGSCTKAMTATLTALAVEEKAMAWDRTMATAFPSFTIATGYRDVSVTLLLQHRGGAPANVPSDIWSSMWAGLSRQSAVEQMLGRAPETPPGTKFVYANAGYMMVGAAVEKAKSDTWENLLQKRLFDPLGMTSCGFGAPASPGKVDQPWGHSLKSGSLSPVAPGPGADNPPSLGPAGTVHCSLVDWGKFLAVHLAGARGESTMLSSASFAELHTPPAGGDYAMGWIVVPSSSLTGGGKALTHAGSNTMFYVEVWIAPSKKRIYVVATNSAPADVTTGAQQAIGEMAKRY